MPCPPTIGNERRLDLVKREFVAMRRNQPATVRPRDLAPVELWWPHSIGGSPEIAHALPRKPPPKHVTLWPPFATLSP